jgi:TonB-dependent starch-binding outer membrane protein SusC
MKKFRDYCERYLLGYLSIKTIRVMKLTFFLSVLTISQLWAIETYSQMTKLTLKLEDAKISYVLKEIENQSEFFFLYNPKQIDVERKVNVDAENEPIRDILSNIFGEKVKFAVYDRQVILTPSDLMIPLAAMQQSKITGTVTDGKTGEFLPGVNVTIAGTTIGSITDANGQYNLQTPNQNEVIVFSFIGYLSQKVTYAGQTVIDIKLASDVLALDEVVVTGYSVEKKKDIIGSVSVVNINDMRSTPSSNVGSQLQGRVSGVTVSSDGGMGSSAKVRIRGFGSFGGSDPLYIIDGVPGSIDALNPNDIESVQVLKDAASSSVYGARAANGVVVVTTNKGKAGDIKVSLDSYYGINYVNKNTFPNLLNAQEYGDWYWKSMTGAGIKYGDPTWGNPQYGNGETPVIPEYILAGGLGGTALEALRISNPAAYEAKIDPATYNRITNEIVKSANTNWFKETFNPAPIQNHQLTVSGGSDKATFLMGLNYFDQKSTADKYSFFTRYSLRVNSNFNINKYLHVGENLQATYTKLRNVGNPGDAWTSPSILPVYDIMGYPSGSNVPGLINTTQGRNPVGQPWHERFDGTEIQNIFGNAFIELLPLEGLVIKSNFGVDYSMNEVNDFTQMTPEYSTPSLINGLTWTWTRQNNWIWTNTAVYSKTLGKHSLKFLLGTEAINSLGKNTIASRTSYKIEDYEPYLVIDAGTGSQSNSGTYLKSTLFSVFGRFDYIYSDKYFINATLRRDGSSKFGSNNKYGYFPAAAIGWRLSSEEFMKNLTWLSDLKLRASYGTIGNQSGLAADNQYTTFTSDIRESYPISGGNSSIALSSTPLRLGNLNARWEKAVSTNIGFDVNFFKGKLIINYDYFIKKTVDLLVINQAPLTGPNVTQPSLNVGTIQNKGMDINISNRGKIFGQVEYEISANFSKYENEAIKVLDNPEASLSGVTNRLGVVTLTKAGYPISYFYGYKIDGFFNSQEEVDTYNSQVTTTWIPPKVGRWRIKDISGPDGSPDGIVNAYDRTYLGSPHPDFQVGMNLSLTFKNFDFSGFLFWSQGGKVLNYNRYNVDFNNYMYNRSALMLNDSWTPEHQNASLPALDLNDTYSSLYATDYFLEDASYLRLKNLQLGYTLHGGLLQKLKIQKFRIYVQAQNLVTFTNKNFSGLDPEVGIRGTSDLSMGVLSNEVPTPQQIIFGVNVQF